MFTKGKGNPKIGEHYHVACNYLEEYLGDPLYDVLLMLMLTYRLLSVTPFVAARGKGFEVDAHKDPAQFAANLAMCILWFLRPKAFPWETDDGVVLWVLEMTKKIKHKGVNNRFLREIDWVQDHRSRPNPQNSKLSLRPREELLQLQKELLSLRKNPTSFIVYMFRSRDSV
jgi:hypothetical protein